MRLGRQVLAAVGTMDVWDFRTLHLLRSGGDLVMLAEAAGTRHTGGWAETTTPTTN